MTGKVLVFAPDGRDEDDPLVRTRWMAARTVAMLADHDIGAAQVMDRRATRSELEAALTHEIAGLAFFSHGRAASIGKPDPDRPAVIQDDAIMGADGPAFDSDNLHLARDRWGHAVACHAGTELAARACDQGAECSVGYEGTLIVDWHPDEVPDDVAPLLVDLVTRTTRNLATGIRSKKELQRAVSEIAEEISLWCQDNPERADGLGLEVTAQQLVQRLVVRSRKAS